MIKPIYEDFPINKYRNVMQRIHCVFILKESGLAIYRRIYSKQFKNLKVDLITPFFSAIFSFSKSVLYKELEVLEMGELRFVFRREKGYIFVILADDRENLIFLESRLKKIAKSFFKNMDELSVQENEIIDDEKFDLVADPIIRGHDDVFFTKNAEKKKKDKMVIDYLKKLIAQNEIKGAALMTMEGNILYSSLSEKILLRSMREIETRYLTGSLDLPEMFCTLKNHQKVCERIVNFENEELNLLLIIEFEKKATLGMAEWIAEEMSEKLKKVFT